MNLLKVTDENFDILWDIAIEHMKDWGSYIVFDLICTDIRDDGVMEFQAPIPRNRSVSVTNTYAWDPTVYDEKWKSAYSRRGCIYKGMRYSCRTYICFNIDMAQNLYQLKRPERLNISRTMGVFINFM